MKTTESWHYEINKERFDQIKSDPSFAQLVALSRVINALRFVHMALEAHLEDTESPAATRSRYNSFMLNCAFLAEAELLVRRMHKHFGKQSRFQRIVNILNEPKARDLLQKNIRPMRNTLVFHFGEDEIARQLKDLNSAQPVYASGQGETNKQTYHELADLCVMKSFFGSAFSSDTEIGNLVQTATEVTAMFLAAAETFIVIELKAMGWVLVEKSQ